MEHFFLDFFFDVFEPITSYDAPGEVAETIVNKLTHLTRKVLPAQYASARFLFNPKLPTSADNNSVPITPNPNSPSFTNRSHVPLLIPLITYPSLPAIVPFIHWKIARTSPALPSPP
jgi:hypothetical protein